MIMTILTTMIMITVFETKSFMNCPRGAGLGEPRADELQLPWACDIITV